MFSTHRVIRLLPPSLVNFTRRMHVVDLVANESGYKNAKNTITDICSYYETPKTNAVILIGTSPGRLYDAHNFLHTTNILQNIIDNHELTQIRFITLSPSVLVHHYQSRTGNIKANTSNRKKSRQNSRWILNHLEEQASLIKETYNVPITFNECISLNEDEINDESIKMFGKNGTIAHNKLKDYCQLYTDLYIKDNPSENSEARLEYIFQELFQVLQIYHEDKNNNISKFYLIYDRKLTMFHDVYNLIKTYLN